MVSPRRPRKSNDKKVDYAAMCDSGDEEASAQDEPMDEEEEGAGGASLPMAAAAAADADAAATGKECCSRMRSAYSRRCQATKGRREARASTPDPSAIDPRW